MKQPKKKIIIKLYPEKKKREKKVKIGSSKLEDKFAREFLDVLGVNYVRQFEAVSIGRFFDFYITDARLIIEIDGDYYHSFNKVYEEMSPMQKKNRRVDKQKDRWALLNGFAILRIWEHDINKNPNEVMRILKERIGTNTNKQKIEEDKKKRH